MRRRGFFTKLLFGGVGGAGAVMGAVVGRPADAGDVLESKLVWHDDLHALEHGTGRGAVFPTSKPVAARSLVVELNGLTLSSGPENDYVSHSSYVTFDGPDPCEVVELMFGTKRGDRLVLRYQTREGSA